MVEGRITDQTYPDELWLLKLIYISLILIWGCSYFVILPIGVNLGIITSLIIYIGCHRSLRLLDHDAIPLEEKETISEGDAYKVPLVASVSLGLFYLAFKYLDKDTVNMILSIYFCLVGIFSLTATFSPLISVIVTSTKRFEFKFGLSFTIAEFLAFIVSTILTGFYFQTKHYMLNNLLGISFCIQALERVSIGSYKIGCIILIGLFFYDIFWVFGTEVMVTVARSFDAPIKLLFPKIFPCAEFPNGKFSLLGLGDIVVPGIFISLLLRYDAVRSHVNPVGAETKAFPKPYFSFTLLSYLLGILLTVVVMYLFNAAQVLIPIPYPLYTFSPHFFIWFQLVC